MQAILTDSSKFSFINVQYLHIFENLENKIGQLTVTRGTILFVCCVNSQTKFKKLPAA